MYYYANKKYTEISGYRLGTDPIKKLSELNVSIDLNNISEMGLSEVSFHELEKHFSIAAILEHITLYTTVIPQSVRRVIEIGSNEETFTKPNEFDPHMSTDDETIKEVNKYNRNKQNTINPLSDLSNVFEVITKNNKKYIVAYKAVQENFNSIYNDKITYKVGKQYRTLCDYEPNGSFGLWSGTLLYAIGYGYDNTVFDFELIKVHIPIDDCIINGSILIRSGSIEIIEVVKQDDEIKSLIQRTKREHDGFQHQPSGIILW